MTELLLFTDGGGFDKGEGKFRAVSSFRFFNGEKELINSNVTISEDGTNAFAEINGIANALEHVQSYIEAGELEDVNVKIYTDSMNCLLSLTVWIFSWIKKARKGIFYSTSGTQVLHQDEFKRAFKAMGEIRKKGKIKFFHINSHTAKKHMSKYKTKFEVFNKVKITDEEFAFIYLQNALCDKMIADAHAKYIESKKPKNNILDKIKEEI